MRDTIRGVPVGNRARERIGYLMRDAITSAWQSENSLSRQYHETVRSRRPATGRCVPRGVGVYDYEVQVVRTNATRVKFMFPPD